MIKYYAGNEYYTGNKYYWESNEQEYKNYKYWFIQYINEDNEYHRLDGPAVEYSSGKKWWYKNGKLHREDGPAVEYSDGDKYYYYNGEKIFVDTDTEFKQYIKMKVFI
jgi:hypothetical protein